MHCALLSLELKRLQFFFNLFFLLCDLRESFVYPPQADLSVTLPSPVLIRISTTNS